MVRTPCSLAAAAGLAAMPAPAQVALDPARTAGVVAGRVAEARASWWGFDAEDATASLQAAIDSKVPKLIVDNLGKPWVVEPIRLVSDQEIVFEDGVEVLAKAGSFKGPNDSLLRADNCRNITLRGTNATLRMRRADYDDPAQYRRAEWRHSLSLRSCSNIKVYGLTLLESGGDGIYLGTATPRVTNKEIHIKDVTCDRNYRQGISVITAENLLIEDTILRGTAGTAPQAGIDFEPNHPEERLVNCVMRNCRSEGNAGCGFSFYLTPMRFISEPISVRLENCVATGNRGAALSLTTDGSGDLSVDGTIAVSQSVFTSDGAPVLAVSKPANRSQLVLTDCQLVATGTDPNDAAPVVVSSGQHADEGVGGIEFVRCLIRDALLRNPIACVDRSGGTPVQGLVGSLDLEQAGKPSQLTLSPELLAQWFPVNAMKQYARRSLEGLTLRPAAPGAAAESYAFGHAVVRVAATYLLYAAAGDTVALGASFTQVGDYQADGAPITVSAPDGTVVLEAKAAFQADTTVTFTAPVTGVYRIVVQPRQNRLAFGSSTHPLCLLQKGSVPIRLIHSAGRFYFWIPKGTREFGIRVAGEGLGEAIRATLLDAEGNVLQEVDNAVASHQFDVALPEPSPGAVGCLKLDKPGTIAWEDHYVDLRGVLPLLAPSPEALIIPSE